MLRGQSPLLPILFSSSLSFAGVAVKAVAEGADKKEAVDQAVQVPQKEKVHSLDLNQVDLEQLEEDWDSTPKKSKDGVGDSVKIKEIIEMTGEYSYASFGRPDPFIQPDLSFEAVDNSVMQNVSPTGKEISIVSPLQGFPLSDLKVKGLWQISSGETRAVILTPRNEGVVVKEGDPISSGKILSIHRDQLRVRLYRLRADGVREYEDVSLKVGASREKPKGVIKLEPGKEPVFFNPEVEKPKPVVAPKAASAAAVPKIPLPKPPASLNSASNPSLPGAGQADQAKPGAESKQAPQPGANGIDKVKDGAPPVPR
ncbi:MAG: hypothetical protein NTX25_19695 [Proteobacteria bacterium]|nr:hypothetical protein [Pseudomonadota bacterium]